MKYTVADGTLIYHDKRVTYFKFHGSPDITIDKKGGEVHAAIQTTNIIDSEQDDQQSPFSDDGVIENDASVNRSDSLVMHDNICYLEKTGELF